jgi:hypothetical protein
LYQSFSINEKLITYVYKSLALFVDLCKKIQCACFKNLNMFVRIYFQPFCSSTRLVPWSNPCVGYTKRMLGWVQVRRIDLQPLCLTLQTKQNLPTLVLTIHMHFILIIRMHWYKPPIHVPTYLLPIDGAFTLDVKSILNGNLGGILGGTQC